MRVYRDSKTTTSQTDVSEIIPVINLAEHPPILGSIAISIANSAPYYADGTQWLPFGGGGSYVIESGKIGIVNSIPSISTDGAYHRVPFDTDMSPLAPPHPSFTINTANNIITINQSGNYQFYYQINPSNTTLGPGASQPEKFVSQLRETVSGNELQFTQVDGSFTLNEGTLSPPSEAVPVPVPYVTLNGVWSGFLSAGSSIEAVLSISADSQLGFESLFGEGGKMQYMEVTKLYP